MIRAFALFAIYSLVALSVPVVNGRDEAIKIPRSVVSNVAASYGSGETRIPNIDGGTDGTISGLANVKEISFVARPLTENPRNLNYTFRISDATAKYQLKNPSTSESADRMKYSISKLDFVLEGAISIFESRECMFSLEDLRLVGSEFSKPIFSREIETSEKERISSYKKDHVATIVQAIRQDFESRIEGFTIDRWTTCNLYGVRKNQPGQGLSGSANWNMQAIDPRSLLNNQQSQINSPIKQGSSISVGYPQDNEPENSQENQQFSTSGTTGQGLTESDSNPQDDQSENSQDNQESASNSG